jgi:hypothetical protein
MAQKGRGIFMVCQPRQYSDAFARTRARGSRVTRVTCRASAILMVNCRCLQQGARLGCDSSRPCRSLRG